MIAPDKVKKASEKAENKNLKFRSYLKNHADKDELDQQFLRLHNKFFANYDCSKCRNCCKEAKCGFNDQEVIVAAKKLEISIEQFKNKYLEFDEGEYLTTKYPCNFFDESKGCILEEAKPDACKKFPHTNQPERIWSLYSVLTNASICPVVFEILEELKRIYRFR